MAEEAPMKSETGIVSRHGRKLKVLLADDSRVTRVVFTHLLEKCGHQVIAVANGQEVLERYQQERFDVILMDVQMPEMNGYKATMAIRSKEAKTGTCVPIIALSAVVSRADLEKCLQAGMDGYLPKNVSAGELVEALDRYVKPVQEDVTSQGELVAAGRSVEEGMAMQGENQNGPTFDARSVSVERPVADEPRQFLTGMREALGCRDELLMEQSALKLKRLAMEEKRDDIVDEAFRVQLAFRRGDLEKARNHLENLDLLITSSPVCRKGLELDMS